MTPSINVGFQTIGIGFTSRSQGAVRRRESPEAPKETLEPFDFVEGELSEVLEGFGLAHVLTASGQLYGLARTTAGIEFSKLREGLHVRCQVTKKFNRVLHAQLLD